MKRSELPSNPFLSLRREKSHAPWREGINEAKKTLTLNQLVLHHHTQSNPSHSLKKTCRFHKEGGEVFSLKIQTFWKKKGANPLLLGDEM